MNYLELEKKCQELGFECPIEQFKTYAKLLQSWNEKMNLTAITEEEEVIEKHFWDCTISLKNKQVEGSWADVGSGAGFPGMVWKIMKPDLKMTLIEPTGKRCLFLSKVIEELSLKNIVVENARAEEYVLQHREVFDGVTARAVSNLSLLSELCAPLIKEGGYFLPLKGKQGMEELASSKNAFEKLGLKLEESQEEELDSGDKRVNLLIKKIKATPLKYPRNYGQMKKKPL